MRPLETVGRLVLPLITAFALMASGQNASATSVENTRAVELTFLKSQPGQRENLKRFIVLNWFAMDKVAKDQGLMSAFTVMETGTDEGPWNVVVSVTYTNARGYEGIAEAFETIRRAHTTVPVDGRSLRDLGAIVESKRLFENPAHAVR